MTSPNSTHSQEVDVQVVGVSKTYAGVLAVDNVSFQIGRGQFFSFLGPSGCGKTTTLRMLGGFIDPDRGEIWIGGSLANPKPPSQRETNMVFQQLALFPHMTVFENIAFGLRMKRVGKSEIQDRVKAMLRLVRLDRFGDRHIRQLSGGQQQRVAIARALVNQPRVLLLDEPLGALDLQLRFEMQQELKRVQHEVGTTFVYVTHDQGEALTMSDHIAVMNLGKLVQVGTPADIYERPKTAFVAKFIGNTNLMDAELIETLPGDRAVAKSGAAIMRGIITYGNATGPVKISLRPEKVLVGARAVNAENRFQAQVLQVTFKGTFFEYRVAILGGPSFDAILPNDGEHSVYPPGSEIDVGWTTASAAFLPE